MTATAALPEVRSLKLYHLHTGERAEIVFKRNGVYDQAGLAKLNHLLRDWRRDETIKMDPHLYDLLWEVYRQSGSHDYINVVCGYRAPETNSMLRKRSRGVAKNSLHMQGKAMDFFIPDVPLAKLRAIGLTMQLGGVGFYPTSGSPFVHMDTGSVRHWPRMTRQQLVKIFPNGHTLHVPSDGKPLPGYAEALALYKQRKATMTPVGTYSDEPVMVASADNEDEAEDDVQAAEAPVAGVPTPSKAKAVGVAVAAYATAVPPLPRLAPHPSEPVIAALPVAKQAPPEPTVLASAQPTHSIAPDFDFGAPQDWTAPAVPAELAQAMAERDQVKRGTSLPIAPTAVVATIDMSRPLRANAITSAVLRMNTEFDSPMPTVLAYASPEVATPAPAVLPPVMRASVDGIPVPTLSPRHDRPAATAKAAPAPIPMPAAVVKHVHMTAPELTMTVLDTVGLRMWMSPHSTRQKAFSLLTMPDLTQSPDLLDKPQLGFGSGFGEYAYSDLRTDRFSGALVEQPSVVDLRVGQQLASIQ